MTDDPHSRLERGHPLADGIDDPGSFLTQNPGQGRPAIPTLGRLQVRVVHRRRRNPDARLPGPWRREGHLFDANGRWAAILAKDCCSHRYSIA
jgi:hypothetical protein